MSKLFITDEFMTTEEFELVKWLLSDDTGMSSKAICNFMLDLPDQNNYSKPMDKWDRGRCIRLLNIMPKWWDRIDEMATIPSRKSINIGAVGITVDEDSWAHQIILIRKEAGRL